VFVGASGNGVIAVIKDPGPTFPVSVGDGVGVGVCAGVFECVTVTNDVEVVVAGRVVVSVCCSDDGAAETEIVIGSTVMLDSPVGDVLIVVVSAVGVAGDVELLGLPHADADDPPKILSAAALSVHPTYTPFVSFIGIAKHCCPFVHTVI